MPPAYVMVLFIKLNSSFTWQSLFSSCLFYILVTAFQATKCLAFTQLKSLCMINNLVTSEVHYRGERHYCAYHRKQSELNKLILKLLMSNLNSPSVFP